ncbi:hypothetical protein COY52_12980 [Candidatus Desantisbacteria bacterium CG_4_10_14_0_8_um_filter_48_22]|uniref:DUF5683 domain-containing protein n=1 Tax=Candidatus Desantisbacteria bacterium CG_4_10_14_0_8_um_filter_48_22 TaxID=1974543 RepID=A0A2M7S4C8_9BACT|nr:MAG: hypothetical protein COY52_12980 [Candidatus Desantisbacteria bacterium CG_4_10_14_0_8_um_filter_48_22]
MKKILVFLIIVLIPNACFATDPETPVRYKDPLKALGMSVVLPGWGQNYCMENTQTILSTLIGEAIVFYTIDKARQGKLFDIMGEPTINSMIPLFWICTVIDAPITAHLNNTGYLNEEKSVKEAVLKSFIPGLGHFYLGDAGSGLFIIGTEYFLLDRAFNPNQELLEPSYNTIIFSCMFFVFYGLDIWMTYDQAKGFNKRIEKNKSKEDQKEQVFWQILPGTKGNEVLLVFRYSL